MPVAIKFTAHGIAVLLQEAAKVSLDDDHAEALLLGLADVLADYVMHLQAESDEDTTTQHEEVALEFAGDLCEVLRSTS